jgi:hypothetical protein
LAKDVARELAPAGARSGPKISQRALSGKTRHKVYDCFTLSGSLIKGEPSGSKLSP